MKTLRLLSITTATLLFAACNKDEMATPLGATDLSAIDDPNKVESVDASSLVDLPVEGNDSTFTGMPSASGLAKSGGVVLTPSSLIRWCPTWVAGDREFNGHGPWTHAYVQLYISGGNKLRAHIYYRVRETQNDWSEAVMNQYITLFVAPVGQTIASINSNAYCSYIYTDTNHNPLWVNFTGKVASHFILNGDTNGNDIGNCTSDDSYMSVYWNPISITLN